MVHVALQAVHSRSREIKEGFERKLRYSCARNVGAVQCYRGGIEGGGEVKGEVGDGGGGGGGSRGEDVYGGKRTRFV